MRKTVVRRQVRGYGLVAEYVRPQGKKNLSPLIVLGGSAGGINPARAARLADEGFAALAVGYFRLPGLSPTLAHIPLEYFGGAIEWLLARPEVSGSTVGVLGGSRGAELALQLASLDQRIGAVVAYAPSSVRWAGYPVARPLPEAAWLFDGKPLPFMLPDGRQLSFDQALNLRHERRHAVIEVEKSAGPILLISGEDDQVWPSTRMAHQIIRRLGQKGFPYEYRHLSYLTAGHRITFPGRTLSEYSPSGVHPMTGETFHYGGTPEGNEAASEHSWPAVVSFFQRHLRN